MKQIIAIGGGGFGRVIKDLKIEKYIRSQSSKDNPKICFIPTATGDDSSYIENFYKAFDSLGCKTSHIDFFKRTINLRPHILDQDIIYVGGGNTKSMLAVWRDWGLDTILKEAYNQGCVMSGVSAGAICWFEKGLTDSWADQLRMIPCMNFIPGSCAPHYDEEPERRPATKKLLEDGSIEFMYGIEGGSALHFKNEKPELGIRFSKNKKSYKVTLENNSIKELPYPIEDIHR